VASLFMKARPAACRSLSYKEFVKMINKQLSIADRQKKRITSIESTQLPHTIEGRGVGRHTCDHRRTGEPECENVVLFGFFMVQHKKSYFKTSWNNVNVMGKSVFRENKKYFGKSS